MTAAFRGLNDTGFAFAAFVAIGVVALAVFVWALFSGPVAQEKE